MGDGLIKLPEGGIAAELNPIPTSLKGGSTTYLDIELGNATGFSSASIFGLNPLVGSATFEDIWDVGGVLTYPTAGETWELVSTSIQDGVSGTGALTVLVQYLDNTYTQQFEIITTNGTTPVTFIATNAFRFIRAIVLTAGSGSTNAGDVTIRVSGQTAQAFLRGRILTPVSGAGGGNTLGGHHTVPAGFTDHLVFVFSGINKNEDLDIRLMSTIGDAGVFSTRFRINLYQNTVPSPVVIPATFTEKSDLKLIAKSTNTNAVGSVALQFVRTENSIIPVS